MPRRRFDFYGSEADSSGLISMAATSLPAIKSSKRPLPTDCLTSPSTVPENPYQAAPSLGTGFATKYLKTFHYKRCMCVSRENLQYLTQVQHVCLPVCLSSYTPDYYDVRLHRCVHPSTLITISKTKRQTKLMHTKKPEGWLLALLPCRTFLSNCCLIKKLAKF
jgi:hypothetical protein